MTKVIAAINMTMDGFCDHTAVDPDEEIHDHYKQLISDADVILYGRKTFDLMKFWKELVKKPSGQKSMDEFAVAMDRIPKIVFSHTLSDSDWNTAQISDLSLEQKVLELKKQHDKKILIGSRSLIVQLLDQGLIDELQLCVHPVVASGNLPLFDKIKGRTLFKLVSTKTFKAGAIVLYYEPYKSQSGS
jgi:dihydrofolate reductase